MTLPRDNDPLSGPQKRWQMGAIETMSDFEVDRALGLKHQISCHECDGRGVRLWMSLSGPEADNCELCNGCGMLRRCPHCELMGLNVGGNQASDEHCDDCGGNGYLA